MSANASKTTDALLQQVTKIAPILRDGILESAQSRRLSNRCVDALHNSNLYKLWWPPEFGGPGASLADATRVVEAIAAVETTSAWNLAIGTLHTGFAGAYLSDVAVKNVFQGSPVIAGQMAPIGKAIRSPAGLVVSGQWSWASGINQSDWILGGALLAENEQPPQPIVFVIPKTKATVDEDSWQVAGLSGTGSCDYTVNQVEVDDGYWFTFPKAERLRGHAVYDQSVIAQSAILHLGFPLGAAQQALNEITSIAQAKIRSFAKNSVAERSTFQTDLALWQTKLDGVRLHAYDRLNRLQDSQEHKDSNLVKLRAAARYTTDLALEITMWAYRSAGGSALKLDSPLQHVVRDMMGASQHVYVDEAVLTAYGSALLEEVVS